MRTANTCQAGDGAPGSRRDRPGRRQGVQPGGYCGRSGQVRLGLRSRQRLPAKRDVVPCGDQVPSLARSSPSWRSECAVAELQPVSK